MNKKVIAAFVAVLLILGVAALAGQKNTKTSKTITPSPNVSVGATSDASVSPSATPDSGTTMITFNGTSFVPAETTVKAGSQIRFTNRSEDAVEVDSDPHPAHTSDADLNLGRIPTGESKTITVTKTGSFGIHDHLNSSITAKITVK